MVNPTAQSRAPRVTRTEAMNTQHGYYCPVACFSTTRERTYQMPQPIRATRFSIQASTDNSGWISVTFHAPAQAGRQCWAFHQWREAMAAMSQASTRGWTPPVTRTDATSPVEIPSGELLEDFLKRGGEVLVGKPTPSPFSRQKIKPIPLPMSADAEAELLELLEMF